MIKVNLLNSAVKPEQVDSIAPASEGMSSSDVQRQVGVRIFLMILIPAALIVYEGQAIPKLRTQESELIASIAELKAFNQRADRAVREIKKFQDDEKKLKKQIEILDRLSKNRLREIQILDLVQQVIPERVWIKGLEFTGPKLMIRGQAMTDNDITTFIEALGRSVFLNDVQPTGMTEEILEDQKVRAFEISASLEKSQ